MLPVQGVSDYFFDKCLLGRYFMDSLFELICHRRSTRKFVQRAVEPEKIDTLTKTALMAPTSKNSKSWQFVVADDAGLLLDLSQCRSQGSAFLANAPLAIVVIADPAQSEAWLEDAAIVSAFIQLQAEALGLGSCWVQVARRPHDETQSAEQYTRCVLSIPETLSVVNIIAIGYKDEERRPYDLERLAYEKIHYNKF